MTARRKISAQRSSHAVHQSVIAQDAWIRNMKPLFADFNLDSRSSVFDRNIPAAADHMRRVE
jgi:hypothetical protein